MWALIEASMFTGIIFISNIATKTKKDILYYAAIFLIFAGISFLFGAKVQSQEVEYSQALVFEKQLGFDLECPKEYFPDAQKEIEVIKYCIAIKDIQCTLSLNDKKFYQEKVNFHKANAERTYKDAKNRCWWLPVLSDRENAKYCFTTAVALLTPNSPQSKLVAATMTLLLQYGLDCIDEWNYIQNKLHWSQYHYEMMEFYQDIL